MLQMNFNASVEIRLLDAQVTLEKVVHFNASGNNSTPSVNML